MIFFWSSDVFIPCSWHFLGLHLTSQRRLARAALTRKARTTAARKTRSHARGPMVATKQRDPIAGPRL